MKTLTVDPVSYYNPAIRLPIVDVGVNRVVISTAQGLVTLEVSFVDPLESGAPISELSYYGFLEEAIDDILECGVSNLTNDPEYAEQMRLNGCTVKQFMLVELSGNDRIGWSIAFMELYDAMNMNTSEAYWGSYPIQMWEIIRQ